MRVDKCDRIFKTKLNCNHEISWEITYERMIKTLFSNKIYVKKVFQIKISGLLNIKISILCAFFRGLLLIINWQL